MKAHPMLRDRQGSDGLSGYETAPLRQGTSLRVGGPLTRILLLQGAGLRIGDRRIALSNRKAIALIAYLVLTPGKKETRDRLIGLLWSETEPSKARGSLRQLLYGLREAFHKDNLVGLSIDNVYVSLDERAFGTDLDCALASIDTGHPDDVLVNEPCITDALFRGYEDVDPAFNAWATVMREKVRQQLIAKLEAQLSSARHQIEATKRIARALLQLDATHEIACQHLMRACVASGNTGGALAAYKQLWDHLEREYDIEPSSATRELVVAIRHGNCEPLSTSFDMHEASNIQSKDGVIDPTVLLAMQLAVAWVKGSQSVA